MRAAVVVTMLLVASPVVSPTSLLAKPLTSGQQRSRELNEQAAALAKAGEVKKAKGLFQESLQLDPGNITAVFNLSSVLIELGQMDEAIPLLERYTKKAPKDAGIFARLGDAYFSSKNTTKAALNYEKALKIDPNYPLISARLGTVYAMSQKVDSAIKNYLTAVAQEPQNTEYLANLSNLYLAKGDSQKAISTAKRGLQIKPSSVFYTTLGSAYEQQKEWENSLIAYKRAKDLGAKDKELSKKIDLLESRVDS